MKTWSYIKNEKEKKNLFWTLECVFTRDERPC